MKTAVLEWYAVNLDRNTLMIPNPKWQLCNYLIIVDYTNVEPRILLKLENSKYNIPIISVTNKDFLPRNMKSGEDFWHTVNISNRKLKDQLGVEAFALRCLITTDKHELKSTFSGWVMEAQNPQHTLESNVRWVRKSELRAFTLEDPFTQALIELWFEWDVKDVGHKVTWSRPGWYAKVFPQLSDIVSSSLDSSIANIEQVRCWERSCVLKINLIDGNAIFLKTVPDFFSHEPFLTNWLSEYRPKRIAEVVKAFQNDETGYHLITKEYSGVGLDAKPDVVIWENTIRYYAELQVSLIEHTQDLIAVGCPSTNLEKLISSIHNMLSDKEKLQSVDKGLTTDEIKSFETKLHLIDKAYDEIRSIEIPYTLDHGDLWSGQVVVSNANKILFNDWSDCSITHPFLSLYFFLDDLEYTFEDITLVNRIEEIYLQHWTNYADIEKLRVAFNGAKILAPLNLAVMYYERILPNMELKWEMEFMFPYHLRSALEKLDEVGL